MSDLAPSVSPTEIPNRTAPVAHPGGPTMTTPTVTDARDHHVGHADVREPAGRHHRPRRPRDPRPGDGRGRRPRRRPVRRGPRRRRRPRPRRAAGLGVPAPTRSAIDLLLRAADAIEAAAEPLAELLSREQGKPLNGPNARFEVGACAGWLRATAATELPGETVVDDADTHAELHYRPGRRRRRDRPVELADDDHHLADRPGPADGQHRGGQAVGVHPAERAGAGGGPQQRAPRRRAHRRGRRTATWARGCPATPTSTS